MSLYVYNQFKDASEGIAAPTGVDTPNVVTPAETASSATPSAKTSAEADPLEENDESMEEETTAANGNDLEEVTEDVSSESHPTDTQRAEDAALPSNRQMKYTTVCGCCHHL